MAGNFRGVASVDASGVTVPPDAPEEKVELYEIKSGDTLSKIAKAYYGKAGDYPRIFDANREVIKDPDKIFVGQMIRIPRD
jgi:nucleoid-associated protein YgaU